MCKEKGQPIKGEWDRQNQSRKRNLKAVVEWLNYSCEKNIPRCRQPAFPAKDRTLESLGDRGMVEVRGKL